MIRELISQTVITSGCGIVITRKAVSLFKLDLVWYVIIQCLGTMLGATGRFIFYA